VLLFASSVVLAQEPPTLIDLAKERYQDGDVFIVVAADEKSGEATVESLNEAFPDAEVTLQTDALELPESPARVLVALPDKTFELPDVPRVRYAVTDRAENETSALVTYRRTPGPLQPLAELGDSVVLLGWKVVRNTRVHPCDVLKLQSWWTVTAPVPVDYSMTYALNPADQDDGIVRTDGAPAGSQMRLWQPDSLFYDERELTVPCDIKPGDYYLVAGIYDWQNGESLWVMPDDGLRVAIMALRITDD
jgi:hypothetical protein